MESELGADFCVFKPGRIGVSGTSNQGLRVAVIGHAAAMGQLSNCWTS